MPLDSTIDQAVADFESRLTEAQNQFTEDVENLREQGLSTEEILIILGGTPTSFLCIFGIPVQILYKHVCF